MPNKMLLMKLCHYLVFWVRWQRFDCASYSTAIAIVFVTLVQTSSLFRSQIVTFEKIVSIQADFTVHAQEEVFALRTSSDLFCLVVGSKFVTAPFAANLVRYGCIDFDLITKL